MERAGDRAPHWGWSQRGACFVSGTPSSRLDCATSQRAAAPGIPRVHAHCATRARETPRNTRRGRRVAQWSGTRGNPRLPAVTRLRNRVVTPMSRSGNLPFADCTAARTSPRRALRSTTERQAFAHVSSRLLPRHRIRHPVVKTNGARGPWVGSNVRDWMPFSSSPSSSRARAGRCRSSSTAGGGG